MNSEGSGSACRWSEDSQTKDLDCNFFFFVILFVIPKNFLASLTSGRSA